MDTYKKETEIINEFAKQINCLDPIYKELSDINCFEILKIDQMEIRHSNFLAWILDPASPSGIGNQLLKRLLLFCSENNDKAKKGLDAVDIELMDLDDIVIKREQSTGKNTGNKNNKRIDLLICSEKGKFCICIENKINTGEGKGQLSNYYKYVEETFARKNTKYTKYKYEYRYYILLSPTGIDAEKEEDKNSWIALSYADLYDWIDEILTTYEEKIPVKAKDLIKDYLNALQRNVIEGAFKKKCEEIYINHADAFAIFENYKGIDDSETQEALVGYKLYDKHRKAIDLVLNNRTELTEKVKLSLIAALTDCGQYVQYDPKRAPAYLKVPESLTNDVRLVDRTSEDISNDFLFYELYYAPGERCYYLNLKCQLNNCPSGFDSVAYGKELSKHVLITSKKINKVGKISISDYIENLRVEHTEPSKDDQFIQNLCKEVMDAMNMAKAKNACQEISKAIR